MARASSLRARTAIHFSWRRALLAGSSAWALSAGLTVAVLSLIPMPASAQISNSGTVGSITNSGDVSSILNSGLVSASQVNGTGIANTASGNDTTLLNTGTILGYKGISNVGAMGTLTNSGTITSAGSGIYQGGNLDSLVNTSTISGTHAGVYNFLSMGSLNNGGTILQGTTTFVYSGPSVPVDDDAAVTNVGAGVIGTLTNTGVIAGVTNAIYNTASLGTISNSGIIAGNIYSPNQDLTLAGGINGTVGILTGYTSGTLGLITSTNVLFTSGAHLLNDNIAVGTGTVTLGAGSAQINQHIAITGNYTQASSANLIVGVTSATSYGELLVSSAATINNSSVVIAPLSGSTLQAGESFTIVSAGTLTASHVTATTGAFGNTVTITGSTLVVTLTTPLVTVTPPPVPVVETPVVVTPPANWTQKTETIGGSAVPLGPVLDTLSTVPTFQPIETVLAGLSAPAQAHALKQINATPTTPQVLTSGSTLTPSTLAVESHSDALLNPESLYRPDTPDVYRGIGWGRLLGRYADHDSSGGNDGYSISSYGLMFGIDTPVSNDAIAGVALSWLRSTADGKDDTSGDHTQINSYQLTGYGTWRPDNGPAYLQGLMALGINYYDQKRPIDFVGETAAASYQGQQYLTRLGGGYDVPISSALTVTPIAGLQAGWVQNDTYTEHGAGVLDLSVARQNFVDTEGELGTKLALGTATTGCGLLSGDVQASWVHSFNNSPESTTASLDGVSFVGTTERLAANGVRTGVGVTLKQSDALVVRLEYDGEVRQDYVSHIGMLKIRTEF